MRTALLSLAVLAAGATACSSAQEAVNEIAVTASVPAPTPTPAAELTVEPGATVSVGPQSSSAPATTAPTSAAAGSVRPSRTAPAATQEPEEPEDPLASRSPLETAPPAGQPTCQASTLTVTDASRAYTLSAVQSLFTIRTNGPDCQLEGYPQIQLRDAGGSLLEVAVKRGGYGLPAGGAAPVTLSKGTSISFFVGTARKAGCQAASALVVTLPGTTTPLRAATTTEVCDGSVGISPVRRETDDE